MREKHLDGKDRPAKSFDLSQLQVPPIEGLPPPVTHSPDSPLHPVAPRPESLVTADDSNAAAINPTNESLEKTNRTAAFQAPYRNALRQARRLLEGNLRHRLSRFKIVPGTDNSAVGIEFHCHCRHCNQSCMVFFPASKAPVEGIHRSATANGRIRPFVITGRASHEKCEADEKWLSDRQT
jgi:hypothetical protein